MLRNRLRSTISQNHPKVNITKHCLYLNTTKSTCDICILLDIPFLAPGNSAPNLTIDFGDAETLWPSKAKLQNRLALNFAGSWILPRKLNIKNCGLEDDSFPLTKKAPFFVHFLRYGPPSSGDLDPEIWQAFLGMTMSQGLDTVGYPTYRVVTCCNFITL